ncbi:phytoene/squalene synthase family protein [Aurantiacibacter spongiae]|nr:phytoene/squalene synthase family protein [Aurantiacibacter spongiae]
MGGGRSREALVRRSREAIRKGSKSFTVASMLFDKDTRDRSHMLYAWCRRCDDIADGQDHGMRPAEELDLSRSSPEDRVEAIRVLTHRAMDGQPTADIAFDALGQVASEARLTPDMADDVIDGFALDAAGWRPRTEGDMMRYCYHVAGAVGVMMARIMGVPADAGDTLDRACDLGLSFQLNNIARDIAEDDAAGRCYLPEEWLAEYDIPPGQHMKPRYRKELVTLVRRLVAMAERHEAAARLGAGRLTFRQRWAVLAAANIYGAIGREVVQQAELAWDHRVHIGYFEKLGHVASAFREAISGSWEPARLPEWDRGKLLVMARMAGPVAGVPNTPLRDEDVRRKED